MDKTVREALEAQVASLVEYFGLDWEELAKKKRAKLVRNVGSYIMGCANNSDVYSALDYVLKCEGEIDANLMYQHILEMKRNTEKIVLGLIENKIKGN